ncbi:hypothetical protein BO71DRAFT_461621 [Aspergillus ellipticus CBS 707.79]|uniref:Uncharacterized protein n=1 Tax=Aspergillus ellipticus CBS 707.79 TaxID=1448320 RepID=A0A319CZH8_9EURO|nr:hypothetical protein BO71DRAFT_461621 [Aspergillus ellipticus CBS 707.79]
MCQSHGPGIIYACRIHIYPLSIFNLTLEDIVEVVFTFGRDLRIFTPKAPGYLLSMIHHLLFLPNSYFMRHRV